MISAKDECVTAAFLMEGLHDAGYDKCIEAWDKGCIELVSELAAYAPEIVRLCNAFAEIIGYEFPGVFDYEVSSSFGAWFGKQIIATGLAPSKESAHSELQKLMLSFFMQSATDSEKSALGKIFQNESVEEGLYVLLGSCGNPDMGQNPEQSLYGCDEGGWLRVASLEEAAVRCREFIEQNGLGSSQWAGGEIRRVLKGGSIADSGIEAKVSYNGRILVDLK